MHETGVEFVMVDYFLEEGRKCNLPLPMPCGFA